MLHKDLPHQSTEHTHTHTHTHTHAHTHAPGNVVCTVCTQCNFFCPRPTKTLLWAFPKNYLVSWVESQFDSIDGIRVIRICVGGVYRKGVWWLVTVVDIQLLGCHLRGAWPLCTLFTLFHPLSPRFAATIAPSCLLRVEIGL